MTVRDAALANLSGTNVMSSKKQPRLESKISEQMQLHGLMVSMGVRPKPWQVMHLAAQLMELSANDLIELGEETDAALIMRCVVLLDRIALSHELGWRTDDGTHEETAPETVS